MTHKKRPFLFFGVFFILIFCALVVIQLAKGYRPDFDTRSFKPTGLLSATSLPVGAQIWVDNQLKGATDNTVFLTPGEYDVEIKKDGFTSWQKHLKIEKELVTGANAWLFPLVPDLKALTFSGAANPVLSPDGSKVVYLVSSTNTLKNGLWVLDLTELPFLTKEPRLILKTPVKGADYTKGTYSWSPDSKQILLTFKNGKYVDNYLLDPNSEILSSALVNITPTLPLIKKQWNNEQKERISQKLEKLPDELIEFFNSSTKDIVFSPDDKKIIYTATASAELKEGLVPEVPASSTQPQERNIKPNRTYIYDIKEDRNFFITDQKSPLWFPTSVHLYSVEKDKFMIEDYDGTNKVTAYSGPFDNLYAYPFPSGTKLLVLTSLGKEIVSNLYSVSLR